MEQEEGARDGSVTAEGVWPPPPTGMAPALGAPAFAPLRPLARPLLVLLTVYAVTAALILACTPFFSVTRWAYSGAVSLLQGVLLLGIAAYFLLWTHRLSRNVCASGAAGLRTAPAWAVLFFFVPLLNLYRPLQTFREIWQASGPAHETRPPALLGFWWTSVLLMSALKAVINENYGGAGIEAADSAADLLCALLTAQVVRLLTARQERGARALRAIE